MPKLIPASVLPRYVVPGVTRSYRLPPVAVAVPTGPYRFYRPPPDFDALGPKGDGAEEFLNARRKLDRVGARRATADYLRELQPKLAGKKLGFLVRINVGQDYLGNPVPATNLISPMGFGRDPIDALAQAFITPQLRQDYSILNDSSYYCWFTNTTSYDCDAFSLEGSRILASQARMEADRTYLLGELLNGQEPDPKSIARLADGWQEFAKSRADAVADMAQLQRYQAISQRLSAAEDRFNDAYGAYIKAASAMARQQREQAMLGKIETLAAIIGTSASLYNAAAPKSDASSGELETQRNTTFQRVIDEQKALAVEFEAAKQEAHKIDGMALPDNFRMPQVLHH